MTRKKSTDAVEEHRTASLMHWAALQANARDVRRIVDFETTPFVILEGAKSETGALTPRRAVALTDLCLDPMMGAVIMAEAWGDRLQDAADAVADSIRVQWACVADDFADALRQYEMTLADYRRGGKPAKGDFGAAGKGGRAA